MSDFLYYSSPPLSVSCKPTVKPSGKKAKELLKRIKYLNHIFDQLENSISCDYFDIEDLKKSQNKITRLVHFILKHFLNIQNTKQNTNTKLDIIYISESRLSQKLPQATNMQLPGYYTENTPNASTADATHMSISENVS